MKYLYVGVLILALLLFGCLASAWEINRRTQAVAEPLERALGALRVGDEAAGQRWAALAAAEWERQVGVLAALISHDRTNGIGEALAGLPWTDGDSLGRALETLLRSVRELADLERVTWRNVF